MENTPNENPNILTFLKKNISLILLGIYTLSFINYYLYYKGFEIQIFNYIGLNDMLFFCLEYIFKIVLLIFLSEVLLYIVFTLIFLTYEKIVIFFIKNKLKLYFTANKATRERIDKLFYKRFDSYLLNFKLTILFLSIFVIPSFGYNLILLPTLFIYFVYYIEKIAKDKMPFLTLTMASVIVIISMIITTLVNSYDKRFEKDDNLISFKENQETISTDTKISCYNYLGETSSHLFLYNIETKESRICSKGNISEFKIQNKNNIDKYIFIIKESFIFRKFNEMLNR
jgi:hypothetical protein